jgi:methanethiol S-methyltransferase
MSIHQHIWLAVCWIIFGVLHSMLATGSVKKILQTIMQRNFKFYRLSYSIIATIMITYILLLNFSIRSILLWQPTIPEKIISVIAGMGGLIVMLVCIRKYFFDLSGVNVFFQKVPENKLQVNGLNTYVRHPLYSATLLFSWSFFFYQPLLSNLISCICISLYTLLGIYFEEQKLIKTFGNDYKDYAAKVPMIVPRFL